MILHIEHEHRLLVRQYEARQIVRVLLVLALGDEGVFQCARDVIVELLIHVADLSPQHHEVFHDLEDVAERLVKEGLECSVRPVLQEEAEDLLSRGLDHVEQEDGLLGGGGGREVVQDADE